MLKKQSTIKCQSINSSNIGEINCANYSPPRGLKDIFSSKSKSLEFEDLNVLSVLDCNYKYDCCLQRQKKFIAPGGQENDPNLRVHTILKV